MLSLLIFLLGACSANADAENDTDTSVEESTETLEETEDEEEINLAAEITTSFKPEVTELRELTDEDLQLYDELLEAVTENAGNDREAISQEALEKGTDPDELWETWLEISDAVMYKNRESTSVIKSMEHSYLIDQVIVENIEETDMRVTESSIMEDEGNHTSTATGKVRINGEEHNFRIQLGFSDDYREAELLQFKLGVENIVNATGNTPI